jgi:hypothetical protein
MRRLLWLGVGLAVGGLVVRKLTQKAQTYSPAGIAHRASASAGGLVESVRSFVEDVREGMAEREAEIHQALAEGALYGQAGADDDVDAFDQPATGNGRHANGRPDRFTLRQDPEGTIR